MLKQSALAEIPSLELHEKPELAAEAAGLHYVSDVQAGYTRRKQGSKFVYLDLHGRPLKNEKHLARIKALVIPPAWSSVWICPDPQGHLQATGRDEKGRKQYRYHNNWQQIRNETKFSKTLMFASKLSIIRARIKRDLELPGLVRNKILAAIVKIMDQTMIRIGNEEYAEKNKSYGLTTIRNRHAEVKGQKVRFKFKGKSGKFHDVEIEDPRIAKIVRKCQDLPGQELFEYESEDGSYADVTSQDVNDYLREVTGENITAKDFRTWGGTVRAALTLQEIGPHQTKTELKKNLVKAVQQTADHLRNTTAVCKKYYIHPCVFKAYEDGSLFKIYLKCQKKQKARQTGLYSEEVFALRLLESAVSERS
jgi:DNA topoisomerase-1